MSNFIGKILCSAAMAGTFVLHGVEYFKQNRWVPTRPEIVKHFKYLEKQPGKLTLQGLDKSEWVYFQVPPVPVAVGNNVVIKLTASGKGSVRIGFNGYIQGFTMVGETSRKVTLTEKSQEFTIDIPVPARVNLARPVIVMAPGSRLDITAYTLEVTGKAYRLDAQWDNAKAVYQCGSEALLTVSPMCNGKPVTSGSMLIERRRNGVFVEYSTFKLSEKNPFTVNIKEDKPGFALIYGTLRDDKGKVIVKRSQLGCAGFDPQNILPGAAAPADLLDYWHGEYAKMKKSTPADVKMTKWQENDKFVWYKISCSNLGGTKTYSTLRMPKGKGPFPMVFTVPPAGNTVYSQNNSMWHPVKNWDKVIHLTISVFDREFADNDAYMKFNRPDYYFYKLKDARESYYYYKSILGVMRMMEWGMNDIKEWDGKNLAAIGRSQGGGFAFIMTALNPRIQAVAADVPALCDHHSRKVDRRPGWPQLLEHKNAANFSAHIPYYDAANFASFIKVPAVVCVGFIDTMCEPASVYAAFNMLKGEKKMIDCPAYGHGWGKRDLTFYNESWNLLNRIFSR